MFKDIIDHSGGGLLKLYKLSPSKLIIENLPEYSSWNFWMFKRVPNNLWKDPIRQKEFLLWLEKKLNYVNEDDWYKITVEVFFFNFFLIFF